MATASSSSATLPTSWASSCGTTLPETGAEMCARSRRAAMLSSGSMDGREAATHHGGARPRGPGLRIGARWWLSRGQRAASGRTLQV